MIFKQHFIEMIFLGIKTQTRHPNRGYYKVGNSYSIQPCRTCKGIEGYKLVIDDIHREIDYREFLYNFYDKAPETKFMPVTQTGAEAEGFGSSVLFERAFRELFPRWNGKRRWVFVYHVVQEKIPKTKAILAIKFRRGNKK